MHRMQFSFQLDLRVSQVTAAANEWEHFQESKSGNDAE